MSFLINSHSFGGGGGGTPIPTGNLVLYQRFNNSLTDETGNHTPTGNSISYANGIYSGGSNESVEFNSNNDYVQIPDDDLLSFGDGSSDSPFSISMCINGDTIGDNVSGQYLRMFLNKRDTGGTGTREYQVSTTNDLNQNPQFVLLDDSAGATLNRYGNTTLSKNTNYHLVFTYDGSSSASGMKIYIDGVEESSYTDASSGSYVAMENDSAAVTLGQAGWALSGDPLRFDGTMDGLGIWDKELSAAEVTAIYNEQSAGNELL